MKGQSQYNSLWKVKVNLCIYEISMSNYPSKECWGPMSPLWKVNVNLKLYERSLWSIYYSIEGQSHSTPLWKVKVNIPINWSPRFNPTYQWKSKVNLPINESLLVEHLEGISVDQIVDIMGCKITSSMEGHCGLSITQ